MSFQFYYLVFFSCAWAIFSFYLFI